jgi:hypothetical protein
MKKTYHAGTYLKLGKRFVQVCEAGESSCTCCVGYKTRCTGLPYCDNKTYFRALSAPEIRKIRKNNTEVIDITRKPEPKAEKMKPLTLSEYTEVKNCTDLTDTLTGIDELKEAIEYCRKYGIGIPSFYRSRLSGLEEKRKKYCMNDAYHYLISKGFQIMHPNSGRLISQGNSHAYEITVPGLHSKPVGFNNIIEALEYAAGN